MVRLTPSTLRRAISRSRSRSRTTRSDLGDDSQVPAALPREHLQDGARSPEAPLGRLVRIGGRPDGDASSLRLMRRSSCRSRWPRRALGVDLVLEIGRVQFHEFVGVARVAVFAAEFAAAVRVDGPLERHVGLGAVENAARRNLEILAPAAWLRAVRFGQPVGRCPRVPYSYFRLLFAFLQVECKRPMYFFRNLPIRWPWRTKWTTTASWNSVIPTVCR